MKANAIVSSFVTFGIFLLLLTVTSASAEERVTLQAGPDMRGAQGEAVISDTAAGNKDKAICPVRRP
jgi:hypothetical protein